MSNEINEMFASISRPYPVEADYAITNIEGEIPRELNGTLYRNGPNQKTAPAAGNRALHFFDGDALIHAFRFDDGNVTCRSRFAQTESFVREQEEGVYCFGGGSVRADKVLESPPPSIQPNTNVVPHSGRLFALVENAPPFEMNPITLESKGLELRRQDARHGDHGASEDRRQDGSNVDPRLSTLRTLRPTLCS